MLSFINNLLALKMQNMAQLLLVKQFLTNRKRCQFKLFLVKLLKSSLEEKVPTATPGVKVNQQQGHNGACTSGSPRHIPQHQ